MTERRMPTLGDARRQVWVRGIIGGSLIGLTVIFLVLYLIKDIYLGPSNDIFFAHLTKNLRGLVDSLLRDWPILAPLWEAIPTSQPRPTVPTSPLWDYLYVYWGALVVMALGGLLLRSAHARWEQIRAFRWEMAREAWRQQDRAARGLAPDDRGPLTVIQQGSWREYPAPPESFSHTTLGSVIIGLGIAVAGGLLLLWAEYGYFQPRWSSGRN